MIDVREFAIEHKFETASIAWRTSGYWTATVHGDHTGEFGCASGYGDTPEEAASAVLKGIRNYREELAAIAAGEEAATANRIAKIKAELESLTGQAA